MSGASVNDVTEHSSLDGDRVRAALAGDALWSDLRVVSATGSTNADLRALADGGAPEGTVVCTDDQRAGRGRLTRTWVSPPGAGIAVSMLLRPSEVARAQWSWLPLVAGLAVADALDGLVLDARLKWPNDVLLGERKVAGILVEIVDRGRAAVVGVGLNVAATEEQLPVPTATSLAIELGRDVETTAVLIALLHSTARWYGEWRTAAAEASPDDVSSGVVAGAYAARSATLGRAVEVTLPDGGVHTGVATAIDANGALVVENEAGSTAFSAGDVTHARSGSR